MKLATYNIASGGFTGYDSASDKPERLALLQKAIRAIDAGIIGLTDTFRWKDIFNPIQLEELFGYSYSYCIDMNDTRVDKRIGLTLLSRHPIISRKVVRLHSRDALKATIKLINTDKLLDIFVVYLDDLSELTRQKQVQALTTYVSNSNPTIVMGDCNALWPEQVSWTEQQANRFLAANPSVKKRSDYEALLSTFDNLYTATALPYLANYGLTESLELRPTALTPLHSLGMPAIFSLDHILSKNCILSDYSVPKGEVFDAASDHYPLMANLKI